MAKDWAGHVIECSIDGMQVRCRSVVVWQEPHPHLERLHAYPDAPVSPHDEIDPEIGWTTTTEEAW